jgi:gliding motility associated protien GldN
MQQVSVYDEDYEDATGPNFKGTPFEGAYTLIAYEDDDFKKPYHNIEDIPIFRARTSLTGITDSLGRQTYDTLRIEARDVLSFMLKEVWFLDKKRSQWDVRILAICPEYRIKKSIGERPYENYEQNVWFNFSQARYYLCNKICYNPHNDLDMWTYDDVFLMRMFNSYIVKERNLQDRMISEYARGLDAILESERIKKELIDFESQLWEY